MCRLYGLRSTHRTRIGCELIDAQNSLIRQSVEDGRGLSNPHGWGLGFVMEDGTVSCRREVKPASEGSAFRDHATDIQAPMVVAHVRRATVGDPKRVNTHPFLDDHAMLAHNGHVDHFHDEVQPRILEALPPDRRDLVLGSTDSEHIFHLLRHRLDEHPGWTMAETLRHVIGELRQWTEAVDTGAEVSANIIWMEGNRMAGSRYGRSLFYIERTRPHVCKICGRQHAIPGDDEDYHVVEVASERLTAEDWTEMPRDTVYEAGPEGYFEIEPLFDEEAPRQ